MKLYVSQRAPNPRRVQMFMAEKGIAGIEQVLVDINAQEHRRPAFLDRNPLARIPVLELDDGRFLSETRAICTYLEGLYPEPNLMGATAEERAFIEMADRRVEWYLMLPLAQAIRHQHPASRYWSNRNSPTLAPPNKPKAWTPPPGSTAPCKPSPGWPASASPSPTSPRFAPWNSPSS